MFTSRPQHYTFNARQATGYTAAPAALGKPDGDHEPAVVLRSLGTIQGVLPVPEALRLATEIADALAAHREKAGE